MLKLTKLGAVFRHPFFRHWTPTREGTVVTRNQPTLPTMKIETAPHSKIVGIVASLTRMAALLVVTAGLGAPHAVAWDQKYSVPPAPLNDPPFPVLPGGVVGPALDAGSRSGTGATLPETAREATGDAMPGGQQAPLVPPPAETREQTVNSNGRLTGNEASNETGEGRSQRRRVGIALGLIGAIGILAVMAALRGAIPRSASTSPKSVLRSRATDTRPPHEADHKRPKGLGVRQVATRIGSRNS